MKKWTILAFIHLFSLSVLAKKTELPGIWNAGAGGPIYPLLQADSIHFGKVILQKELILVNLYPGFAVVKGEYSFENTGEKSISMYIGFPIRGRFPQRIVDNVFFDESYNFRVLLNGQPVKTYRLSDSGKINPVRINGAGGTDSTTLEFSDGHAWLQEFPSKSVTKITVYFITRNSLSRYIKGNDSRDANAFGYALQSGKAWGGKIGTGQILVKMNEGLSLIDIQGILPDSLLKGDLHHLQYSFSNPEPGPSDNMLIWYEGAAPDFKFDKKVLPSTDTLYQIMDAFPISEFSSPDLTLISRKNFSVSKSGLTFSGVVYFLMFFLPWIILAFLIVFLLKGKKKMESGKSKIESERQNTI